ncbi:MAG: hypothetical protein L0220_23640, partial [Acidobacteria bacterium]|nr:hypothetical protein [Acidobacteriota bacterium]
MYQGTSNKSRLIIPLIALLFFSQSYQRLVYGQEISEAQRLNELRRLRDEIRLSDSLRSADVTVVMGERMITNAARQLVGLQILMSNGGILQLTSIECELKPAAAVVKIGVQAKSTVSVNLLLTGRLGTGEMRDDVFQVPFRITNVDLTNGPFTSLFLKTFLGSWLSPKKWNDELPPLEIPLEIAEAMQIRASRFNVEASPPMEISTPDYRSQLRFHISSLLVLDKRLALGLQMVQGPGPAGDGENVLRTSFPGSQDYDLPALENEVARLSENLASNSDLRLRLNRRVISRLLEQIAVAHGNDFSISLKPGRVRTEEVDTLVRVL